MKEHNLNEMPAAALALPAAAGAIGKIGASVGAAVTGANMLNGLRKKPKMDSFSSDFLKNGPSTSKPTTKKPLPTTAKLNTIKPSRDYQKEKAAQTASSSTVAAPAPGATKDEVKSPPATTGTATNTGAGAKTGADAKTGAATKTGTAAKTAAGTAAAGLGAVALRALRGKLDADKGPEIGSTSKRVKIKPNQTEEELELVCDYLLNEGYVSTGVEAENIYSHMSEEWKEYILNS